jgi:hypothetical protein
MDVHGTCDVARKNGGKVFSYTNPPPEGHSPDCCLPRQSGFFVRLHIRTETLPSENRIRYIPG